MIQRYDPSISVYNSIDSQDDRVQFISGVVRDFYEKSNCRLDAKRLYASDGHAVKELLKIATILVHAVQVERNHRSNHRNDPHSDQRSRGSIDLNIDDVRELRSMATKITESGARLHSLLQREMEAKKSREEVSNFLETANSTFGRSEQFETIQETLTKHLDEVKSTLASIEEEYANMETDERHVMADMKKKKDELDRNNQRLRSLEQTRPTFMDEYEKFEIELENLYELYVERYRNVDYLKDELEKIEKEEKEQLEEANRKKKRLQAKVREDELIIMRGDTSADKRTAGISSKQGDANSQGPMHTVSEEEDSDEEEASEIVIEDDSSADESQSSTLQSNDEDLNGLSETSSKTSMSGDSASYFLGSNHMSGTSASNSGNESDDSDANNF